VHGQHHKGDTMTTIVGTPGADLIQIPDPLGAPNSDFISGGAGHDTLDGSAGQDTLLGEAGDDYIRSGYGFYSGSDKTLLSGGSGDDVIQVDYQPLNDHAANGTVTVQGGTGMDIALVPVLHVTGGYVPPPHVVYAFDRGDGVDVVTNTDLPRYGLVGPNRGTTVKLGTGITSADVQVVGDDQRLVLRIKGTADAIAGSGRRPRCWLQPRPPVPARMAMTPSGAPTPWVARPTPVAWAETSS